jgi:hypothetical protein
LVCDLVLDLTQPVQLVAGVTKGCVDGSGNWTLGDEKARYNCDDLFALAATDADLASAWQIDFACDHCGGAVNRIDLLIRFCWMAASIGYTLYEWKSNNPSIFMAGLCLAAITWLLVDLRRD